MVKKEQKSEKKLVEKSMLSCVEIVDTVLKARDDDAMWPHVKKTN